MSQSYHSVREALQAKYNFMKASRELAETLDLLERGQSHVRCCESCVSDLKIDMKLASLWKSGVSRRIYGELIEQLEQMHALALAE